LNKPITILAIESSCDETSAAVIINGNIVSNVTASQDVHQQYGGVVPELASRVHQLHIVPVVDAAIKKSGVALEQFSAIAVTAGPGLIGSLMVGVSFAKAMALSLNIPLISVQHMQAHVSAHFIRRPIPAFPFLCLTVSGGHTQIVLVRDFTDMAVIGETRDDAAGEAFDKTAKMLGIPYPGGPLIDKLAQQGKVRFEFPLAQVLAYDFSFSGLKTAIRNFIQQHLRTHPDFIQENKSDIAASVQHAIVTMLMQKVRRASQELQINRIAIAGGVAANSGLRKALLEWAKEDNVAVFIPDFEYCTDNAAMIAMSAHYKYINKQFSDQKLVPSARLTF
jgi:N6-L-threonylcarbamoyladenine synthase